MKRQGNKTKPTFMTHPGKLNQQYKSPRIKTYVSYHILSCGIGIFHEINKDISFNNGMRAPHGSCDRGWCSAAARRRRRCCRPRRGTLPGHTRRNQSGNL